ncbi:succinate dehydrogenase assembly factor 2 [Liberibacter sp. Z1]|nr:succinate dehydrogenase assembly factor 2 [Candidatus Liberibacter sp.]
MSKNMNLRCRRIVYRCWRRGTREMDLILGRFTDREIANLSEVELDMLESLLDEDDGNLFKWFTGMEPIPEHLRTPIFDKIYPTFYSLNSGESFF